MSVGRGGRSLAERYRLPRGCGSESRATGRPCGVLSSMDTDTLLRPSSPTLLTPGSSPREDSWVRWGGGQEEQEEQEDGVRPWQTAPPAPRPQWGWM